MIIREQKCPRNYYFSGLIYHEDMPLLLAMHTNKKRAIVYNPIEDRFYAEIRPLEKNKVSYWNFGYDVNCGLVIHSSQGEWSSLFDPFAGQCVDPDDDFTVILKPTSIAIKNHNIVSCGYFAKCCSSNSKKDIDQILSIQLKNYIIEFIWNILTLILIKSGK